MNHLVVFPNSLLDDILIRISHNLFALAMALEVLKYALVADSVGPDPPSIACGLSFHKVALKNISSGNACIEKTAYAMRLKITLFKDILALLQLKIIGGSRSGRQHRSADRLDEHCAIT